MAGKESAEREALKKAYPGDRWTQRVKGMSDNQVTAVYLRLKNRGVLK